MTWTQREISLPPMPSGLHLITAHVVEALPELKQCRAGLLHIFIMHTSASLSINENADPDVATDLKNSLDRLAPEEYPYEHTCEGPDDMPAHIKTALTDTSLTVPIREGRLALGTWQGVFLCEHRRHATGRRLVLTLHGNLTG